MLCLAWWRQTFSWLFISRFVPLFIVVIALPSFPPGELSWSPQGLLVSSLNIPNRFTVSFVGDVVQVRCGGGIIKLGVNKSVNLGMKSVVVRHMYGGSWKINRWRSERSRPQGVTFNPDRESLGEVFRVPVPSLMMELSLCEDLFHSSLIWQLVVTQTITSWTM